MRKIKNSQMVISITKTQSERSREVNTIKDPFEKIRHMQVQMPKLYSPILTKKLEEISRSVTSMIEQYQQQLDLISKGITASISDQYRSIQESMRDSIQDSFNPFIKSISHQQELLQELLRQQIQIPELTVQRISEWQSIIGKINYPSILGATIPKDIYASLNGLTCELEGRIEVSSNLSADLTVVRNAPCEEHIWTWYQLVMLLFAILPYYFNHVNAVQQDSFHKEILNELKQQTVLEERILGSEGGTRRN